MAASRWVLTLPPLPCHEMGGALLPTTVHYLMTPPFLARTRDGINPEHLCPHHLFVTRNTSSRISEIRRGQILVWHIGGARSEAPEEEWVEMQDYVSSVSPLDDKRNQCI
jgi:hypothetical protein